MPSIARSQIIEFLNQVHNEGGVMFAGLAEKAWGGADEKAAEAAYELAWEELHGAPWQSVSLVWRDAFSLSCLFLASCHHNANRSIEALTILNLGVMMGGPHFRTQLEDAQHCISSVTGTVNGRGATNSLVGLTNFQDFHLITTQEK